MPRKWNDMRFIYTSFNRQIQSRQFKTLGHLILLNYTYDHSCWIQPPMKTISPQPGLIFCEEEEELSCTPIIHCLFVTFPAFHRHLPATFDFNTAWTCWVYLNYAWFLLDFYLNMFKWHKSKFLLEFCLNLLDHLKIMLIFLLEFCINLLGQLTLG